MISLIIPPKVGIYAARPLKSHTSRTGSNLASISHVDPGIRHSVQHQVACQSSLSPRGHHIHPTTSQTLQSRSPKWSRSICWHDLDRRRQGKEGLVRLRTPQADQHVSPTSSDRTSNLGSELLMMTPARSTYAITNSTRKISRHLWSQIKSSAS
jgi:hypothetical protein